MVLTENYPHLQPTARARAEQDDVGSAPLVSLIRRRPAPESASGMEAGWPKRAAARGAARQPGPEGETPVQVYPPEPAM